MSRLVLWKAKISHLESFQELPHVSNFLPALRFGASFLSSFPLPLGILFGEKGSDILTLKAYAPFLQVVLGSGVQGFQAPRRLQRIFQKV